MCGTRGGLNAQRKREEKVVRFEGGIVAARETRIGIGFKVQPQKDSSGKPPDLKAETPLNHVGNFPQADTHCAGQAG